MPLKARTRVVRLFGHDQEEVASTPADVEQDGSASGRAGSFRRRPGLTIALVSGRLRTENFKKFHPSLAMRIYRGKIKPIAEDIVNSLVREEDIEVPPEEVPEVILDVEAIIKEHLRMEEEIASQAREMIQKRGISYTEFGKLKRMIAEEKGFESGDKAIIWITNQIIESFMYNNRVEEVYTEDHRLRQKIAKVFDTHLGIALEVDREVRDKIKHLEEGTPEWDIEYQKLYRTIARRKGLL